MCDRYSSIRRIIGWAVAFFAVLFCVVNTQAGPVLFETPLSPRTANYEIDVRLDTEKRLLHGKETLTWHNQSTNMIDELQFHLYLNAFRNSRSTAFTEGKELLKYLDFDADGWGGSEIDRVSLKGGEDLTDKLEFIQPDDDNENDKTVVRLPLPAPLLPGDSIEVEIDFTAKLPSPPLRTGAKGEFFFVAQWFPKIGVYQDHQWNCHQFHANTEFFADFGVYDVRMTVPKENIVGATGTEVEVTQNDDGTSTHYYHAEDVHDFAWTTSPEYIVVEGRVQDVDIRVLMQPDHIHQGERHLEAAKGAVGFFQDWIGDYPYPNLTVVDPRSGAGGMEYPTLITAGTSYGLPDGIRTLELVIIHEFAHNYWYHMLATNEFEEPWLDEGFTNYSELKIMEALYGDRGNSVDFLGIKLSDLETSRVSYMALGDIEKTARLGWEYYSRGSYAINAYNKSALMLTTLENYLGDDLMRQVLRTYYDRWRFKHPKTADFIQLANEVTGQDLTWFFNQWLHTNATVDYTVDKLKSEEMGEGEGYDFTLVPFEKGKEEEEEEEDKDSKKKLYESEVSIRRLGDFVFPVEIEIKFEDGKTIREKWDGKDYWKKFTYVTESKLASATVDPDNKVPIDLNLTNNSQSLEPKGRGVTKLTFASLFFAQTIFEQPELANLFTLLKGVF